MIDNIKTNARKVREGWQTFGRSCRIRWRLLGQAADDKEWGDVLHHLVGGFLSDALQDLYRTWLYLIIVVVGVWLVSLTGAFNWPLTWTGF
jgi:hypothetical protein